MEELRERPLQEAEGQLQQQHEEALDTLVRAAMQGWRGDEGCWWR